MAPAAPAEWRPAGWDLQQRRSGWATAVAIGAAAAVSLTAGLALWNLLQTPAKQQQTPASKPAKLQPTPAVAPSKPAAPTPKREATPEEYNALARKPVTHQLRPRRRSAQSLESSAFPLHTICVTPAAGGSSSCWDGALVVVTLTLTLTLTLTQGCRGRARRILDELRPHRGPERNALEGVRVRQDANVPSAVRRPHGGHGPRGPRCQPVDAKRFALDSIVQNILSKKMRKVKIIKVRKRIQRFCLKMDCRSPTHFVLLFRPRRPRCAPRSPRSRSRS